ncbi:hypothetical protein BI347_21150 [Chromobacterium sphagni]|uniref:Uncharacterized protein n=2 Tax=Chromobacterium sphagni TaxID=1903179 RepID=A0A1S1WSY0_9NEIS|nr:hypothetical protein BI347_21150 [Chromobacterium sphagni]OHX19714.1 hypothetical protein BI344_08750 [Chromobacterium sphagni]
MKLLLLAGLILAGNSWAMSKPYDAEATAVMKDGKPCFYLKTPIEGDTPDYLKGQGVSAEVFNETQHRYMWKSWYKTTLKTPPTSPQTCISYGTKSPDKNRMLALPLTNDTAYIFDMFGEYGRNRLYFCIKKDAQGKDYLSKSGPQANCSTDPL